MKSFFSHLPFFKGAKKQKSRTFKFVAAFLASVFVSFVLVVIIGWIVIDRVYVVPPELPPMPTRHPPTLNIPPSSTSQENENDDETELTLPWYYGLVAPERFTEDDRRDNFFTFMIIGLTERYLANTIMVASYNYETKEAHLISIPRDSLINTNRIGRKLASSYLAGGIAALQRDVMTVIGFVPDFYVILDYDAFFAIIDAVGGIIIDVPFHMRYDDPFQDLFIDIPEGLQRMDSYTALHFSRFRQSNIAGFRSPPNSDYFRIESQQKVINAVISELLRPSNLVRVLDFVDIFHDAVETNLEFGNMLWFARELNHIRGTDALVSYTAPMLGTSGEPMWYELLNARGIVDLVNRTINPFYRDIELRDVSIVTQ